MKINEKVFLLIIIGMIFTTQVNAQSSVTLDASQHLTSFKFTDSQANTLTGDYSGIYTGSYGLGYRYLFDFGLFVKPGLSVRNGGSSLTYDDMNYSWNLKYLDGKLGIGYQYKLERLSPYFIVSGYYSYMLYGTQILNNEEFNIKELDLLEESDYGLIIAPGVEFEISPLFAVYFEFNYLWGLKNLEKDDSQSATNYAYGLTLGLSLSFPK